MSIREFVGNIIICIFAVSIPLLLIMDGVQARRFAFVKAEISRLEQKQSALIESNKNLITGISMLSNADRIEEIASTQLGMRLAESKEIIRVEMKDNSK